MDPTDQTVPGAIAEASDLERQEVITRNAPSAARRSMRASGVFARNAQACSDDLLGCPARADDAVGPRADLLDHPAGDELPSSRTRDALVEKVLIGEDTIVLLGSLQQFAHAMHYGDRVGQFGQSRPAPGPPLGQPSAESLVDLVP